MCAQKCFQVPALALSISLEKPGYEFITAF